MSQQRKEPVEEPPKKKAPKKEPPTSKRIPERDPGPTDPPIDLPTDPLIEDEGRNEL